MRWKRLGWMVTLSELSAFILHNLYVNSVDVYHLSIHPISHTTQKLYKLLLFLIISVECVKWTRNIPRMLHANAPFTIFSFCNVIITVPLIVSPLKYTRFVLLFSKVISHDVLLIVQNMHIYCWMQTNMRFFQTDIDDQKSLHSQPTKRSKFRIDCTPTNYQHIFDLISLYDFFGLLRYLPFFYV